jgi:hypothetical protein
MNKTSKRWIFAFLIWPVSLLFAFGLPTANALADSKRFAAANATWKAECGSCHLAYPPNLLPAPAWRRVMAGLGKHFGTDASIDARAAAEIGAFLESNAAEGRKRGSDSGGLRITETPWFTRKHREVAASTWKSPRVQTPANCAACHLGAERGDFDEHAVRIPR